MKCPICYSINVSERSRDQHTSGNRFMECNHCGHRFCSLPTSDSQLESFNKKAFFGNDDSEEFPEWFKNNDHTDNHHAEWLRKKIDRFWGNGEGNLIDIGCGLGGLLKYFVNNTKFKCHGNDIAPKACGFVRKHLGIPVFEGAFSASLAGNTQFDIVIASHLLEHLEDPHALIKDVKSVCNPGAIFVAICPHEGSLTARLKRNLFYPAKMTSEFGHLHYPMHLQGYTKTSMSTLFALEGYTHLQSVTLSKAQSAFGCRPNNWKERVMLPLYIVEALTNTGNHICSFFRVNK